MSSSPSQLIKGVVILFAAVSGIVALGVAFTDSPGRAFVLPILIEAAILIVLAEVNGARRRGLRLDGISLFLCFELLRGCVMPALTAIVGQAPPQNYHLGSWEDAGSVLLLGNVFAASVLCAQFVVVVLGRWRQRDGRPLRTLGASFVTPVPTALLIALGCVGLLLRFPNVGAVEGFLSGRVDFLAGGDHGIVALSASLLRPLLSIGLGILLVRRIRARRPFILIAVLLLASVILGLGSYGLNRATAIYAVVAFSLLLLEWSTVRLTLVPMAFATMASLGAFLALGSLRRELTVSMTGLDPVTGGIVYQSVQSVIPYAAPPLQLATALPPNAWSRPWGIDTLISSILSTVPGMPDQVRDHTGTVVFNEIIYRSDAAVDQLLPSWFELYLSLGTAGLIAAGILLVLFLVAADWLRRCSANVLSSYGATMATIWIAQASNQSIVSIEQNLIYFAVVPALLGLCRAGAATSGGLQPALPTLPLDSGPTLSARKAPHASPLHLRDLRIDARIPGRQPSGDS